MVKHIDSGRFYKRSSNGKYILDVEEIRAAFLQSETFAIQARTFRTERLASIIDGQTPIQLAHVPKIIMHIVPFSAFDVGKRFELQNPPHFSSVHPIGGYTTNVRFNFDGMLRSFQGTYVQLYRDGQI